MIVENRIDFIDRYIPPAADDSPFSSQQIPLGLAHGSNIGVHEFGLLPVCKEYLQALLIIIGHITPDTLMALAGNRFNMSRNDAHDPVKIVASPVKGGAP